MPEALQQVRDDLGEQAVILNTRRLRRNNRFNLADEARVEVTAAYDEAPAVVPPAPAGLAARRYGVQLPTPTLEEPMAPPRQLKPPAPAVPSVEPAAPPVQPASGEEGDVARQLRRLRDTVARLERKSGVSLPDELGRLRERFASVGLAADLSDHVVGQLLEGMSGKALADRRQVGERAATALLQRLPQSKRIKLADRRQVIGFFGASGVGKTTAAAKIAAGFTCKLREQVVLVSTDDQRVGARDQVDTFARIIGVPLELAHGEEEMREVLARYEAARLVLIDSPGCGPQDHKTLGHQARLFAAAGVSEVHVVIDALHGLDHMLDMLEASRDLPERRLLFAKMDEMVRSGPVLSAAIESQIPTSYLAVGTRVPGDIEAGNLDKLVEQIVGYGPKKKK